MMMINKQKGVRMNLGSFNQENYMESQDQQLLSDKMKRFNTKYTKMVEIIKIQSKQYIEENINSINSNNTNKIGQTPNLIFSDHSSTTSNLNMGEIIFKKQKKEGFFCNNNTKASSIHYKLFQIRKNNNPRSRIQRNITQLQKPDIKQYTGYAMLLLPNMRKYEGQWVNGVLVGEATIQYPDKTKYVGRVYRFKKHGMGVETKPNGQKYVGQFCYGEYHGQGKLYNKDGVLLYEGEWRRGKKHIYQQTYLSSLQSPN